MSTTIPYPNDKLTREEIIDWMQGHADDECRAAYVKNAFDPKAKRLTKTELSDMAKASWQRQVPA